MQINDVTVIPFHTTRHDVRHGGAIEETNGVQTLTRITTDDGAEGFASGERRTAIAMD